MEKRIRRWKHICLGLILYELAISLLFIISSVITIPDVYGFRSFSFSELLFMLNPCFPLQLFLSLTFEFILGDLPDWIVLLLPIAESLLLLLGWKLAAAHASAGSRITVACGTLHLLLEVLCLLFFPVHGILSFSHFLFPILLVMGYARWQPPMR